MKKIKHNKKRNTGFLYEVLIKELTKMIVHNNLEKKTAIVAMVKEHFGNNSVLAKELQLYKAMQGLHEVGPVTAEKIIYEAKEQYKSLDKEWIFNEQSQLINKINRILSRDVFSNFVPNYKNLATIAQIFSNDMPLRSRILLEESLFKEKNNSEDKKEMVPIDDLVYKTFVNKFNDKYGTGLLKEQRELLNKYIVSFSDNELELKVYLNDEIRRLKRVVVESLDSSEDVKGDKLMAESTKKVLDLIDGFKEKQIDVNMLEKILKIQNLTSEMQNND